jgi:ABC-type amino acid transport system permease subunit
VDWDTIAKVTGAVVPAVAAVLGYFSGPGRLRSHIRYDVDTLVKLPDGSAARRALDQLVSSRVEKLRKVEVEGRVDLTMLVVSLIATPLLVWTTVWLFGHPGWIWKFGSVITGVVAFVFVYGIFESAQRVPRDEKGRVLPSANG